MKLNITFYFIKFDIYALFLLIIQGVEIAKCRPIDKCHTLIRHNESTHSSNKCYVCQAILRA